MKAVICAVAKKENDYINDWCKWHLNLGFSDIYIYDNNDIDYEPIESRIDKSIIDKVHITKIPFAQHFQRNTYTDFYNKNNNKFDWCAFIDIDEFFFLNKWKNINEMLSDNIFKNESVININWEIYDDNNVVEGDVKIPVWKRFTHKTSSKWRYYQTKSIVRTGLKEISFTSVHFPSRENTPLTSINVDGSRGKTMSNEAYLRHYMTKTLSEFMKYKFNRGDAATSSTRLIKGNIKKQLSYFFEINNITPQKISYLKSQGIDTRFLLTRNILYWHGRKNAGDQFSIYLVEKLHLFFKKQIAIVGSILSIEKLIKKANHIWGAGFHHSENDKVIITDLSKYYLVRGFKSKKILNNYGDTSHISVGDPGLLASYIYSPNCQKKYDIGVISHWQDETLIQDKLKNFNTLYKIKFISMQTTDVEKVLTEINECKCIISSSLHGLIFSHSYQIPAVRLRLENSPYSADFKFEDYYSTLSINDNYITDLNKEIFDRILQTSNNKLTPSIYEVTELQINILKSCPKKINSLKN